MFLLPSTSALTRAGAGPTPLTVFAGQSSQPQPAEKSFAELERERQQKEKADMERRREEQVGEATTRCMAFRGDGRDDDNPFIK